MSSLRPLQPFSPIDQVRLLRWLLLQPEVLARYRANSQAPAGFASQSLSLASGLQSTGAWLASSLAFLLVAPAPLAIWLGAMPRPEPLSAGFVPVLCAWLAAGWAASGGWAPMDSARPETEDAASRLLSFSRGGVGLSGMLVGIIGYMSVAFSGSALQVALLIAAFFVAAIQIASIASILAPGSQGAAVANGAEVLGTIALPLSFIAFVGERLAGQISELASIFLCGGLFVLAIVALQGFIRLNRFLERLFRATHRPAAFWLLPALLGLAYAFIIWFSLLNGWQVLGG